MGIKIIHTADHHIGTSFANYPKPVRDRLIEERFDALDRLIRSANSRNADFVVIAGDLFDRQRTPRAAVTRTAQILARFEGEHVLVLAGNHDYYEGPDNDLWKTFREAADGTCILPLLEADVKEFELDAGKVRFYACPCPSKHGREHVIGWVAGEDKAPDALHLGIAHGNVEGLGLDNEQRYFTMSERDLRESGVHTWLLGHIHVPAPASGTVGHPLYYMSGTHTPDSVKCAHGGHAWWIEFQPDGARTHELLNTGELSFVRLTREIEHPEDLARLESECAMLDPAKTVLDLQVSGRVGEEDLVRLRAWLDAISDAFLHVSSEVDIAPVLDAGAIAARFPDGTLPNEWLHALLENTQHPGDAHMALELIESLRPS